MEIFPQSTKCINYYPLITNIGYNEGIYRSQALRYNESSLYDISVYVHIKLFDSLKSIQWI